MKNRINVQFVLIYFLVAAFISIVFKPSTSLAENSSETLLTDNPQKLARGLGHFERSRSMLLAAIREFDSGYKYVKTDQVLDAELWRKTLLARAQELETILSPEPREIKAGSRYEPDSRILGARVKPPAKLEKDPIVKPEKKIQPEAKTKDPQISHKESLDLEMNGS
jgi:hypothetical protein